MSRYKTVELPKSNHLLYVTFSVWDNTAGPSTKRVWEQSACKPGGDEIRLLTRLVLKTEITRDPSLPNIDCNIYNLPALSAFAVSYLFGAVSKSKSGRTVYCITYVYRIAQQTNYLQWNDILDSLIKQDIAKYKILLHRDFDARCTDTSIAYLNQMMQSVVKLIDRLDQTKLDCFPIQVEETYFVDIKPKEQNFLREIVSSMLLSFGRVIVVGSIKNGSTVNKWVRTLCAVLSSKSDQHKCFTCGPSDQTIIPNAMVQGILTIENILENESALLTLYSTCAYPVTVADLSKRKVYRSSKHTLHQLHQERIINHLYFDIYSTGSLRTSSRLSKMLKETASDICKNIDRESSLMSTMFEQMYHLCNHQARLGFLSQYMAFLNSQAAALVHYVRTRVAREGTTPIVPRSELMKYQFLQGEDIELVLCMAEIVEPGIYSCVENDCVDSKSKDVNNAI